MSKNEIVESWYREGVVQDIVRKFSRHSKDRSKWEDLISIVYLSLLEKEEEVIQQLQETGTYRFYIARMVCNQVKSSESSWYYKVLRYGKCAVVFDGWENAFSYREDEDMKVVREYVDGLEGEYAMIADILMNNWSKQKPMGDLKEYLHVSYKTVIKKLEEFGRKIRRETGIVR